MSVDDAASAIRGHVDAARRARSAGNFRDAAAALVNAIAGLRAAGDSNALAHALRHLGDILAEGGELEAAAAPYAEAEQLYTTSATADALDVANAHRSFALHAQRRGDAPEALRRWNGVRAQYAALDEVFRTTYGLDHNPGVRECDARLAELGR